MVAASDRIVLLSAGEKHDAPQGRKLIERLKPNAPCSLVMVRAYEDEQTRALAIGKGFSPVVPPKKSRLEPWDYDEELYKRRNEVERLFRRIKRFRRVFTRYDKLDVMYLAFLTFALIIDAIK